MHGTKIELSERAKWGIMIAIVVLGICLVVVAWTMLIPGLTSDDAEEDETVMEGTSSNIVLEHEVSTPTPEPTATPTAENGDDDSSDDDTMTWEEISALTDEELAYYLGQIVYDTDYQDYINNDTEEHDDPFYYEKYFLETHPDYSIPGFGNPYAESAAFVGDEDGEETWAALTELAEAAVYDSTPAIYVYNDEGDYITIGTSDETDNKGIYIVPTCSAAIDSAPVGFYFLSNSNTEVNTESRVGDLDSVYTRGYNNFYITAQTYDKLTPAKYDNTDSETGWYLRWSDIGIYSGSATESDIIYGRAVNLSSGELIATFHINIAYDSTENTYYIESVTDSDVIATGDIDGTQRSELISRAVDELSSGNIISFYSTEVTIEISADKAIVEHLDGKTYFTYFYDPDMQPTTLVDVNNRGNVYAVSIPVTGLGFATLYFSPTKEVAYGYLFADPTGKDGFDYIGFDALYPQSVDTILDLNGFIS